MAGTPQQLGLRLHHAVLATALPVAGVKLQDLMMSGGDGPGSSLAVLTNPCPPTARWS